MKAIIEVKGKQFTVKEGDKIKVPKLDNKDEYEFPVLAIIKDGEKIFGTPYVKNAVCRARLLGHGRSRKIIVYKYIPKEHYRRKKSARIHFSEIEIQEIKW